MGGEKKEFGNLPFPIFFNLEDATSFAIIFKNLGIVKIFRESLELDSSAWKS